MVDHNGLFSYSPNLSNNRNGPACFRCGEQGHMRNECTNRVFCSNCKSGNHCNRTCRKLRNNTSNPHPHMIPSYSLNDQNPAAPTTGAVNNRLWFENHHELNQPRSITTVHTPPANNMSQAQTTNMTEGFMQILSQAITNNKGDGMKQMMKNIKLSMEQTKLNASPGSARLKQPQNSVACHSENYSAKEWLHLCYMY